MKCAARLVGARFFWIPAREKAARWPGLICRLRRWSVTLDSAFSSQVETPGPKKRSAKTCNFIELQAG
jgi:hypothetical protein